jgi:hypothetical protein
VMVAKNLGASTAELIFAPEILVEVKTLKK